MRRGRVARLSRLIDSQLPTALLAFAVYLATLAPSVVGYDSAELATGAYKLGIVHPTGYPLYLLLGKLFTYLPLGSIAYRVNLMSAVFGAATVWLVARLAQRWTGRPWLAAVAGLALGMTPVFWSLSIVAEVYTLHTMLLALSLTAADRWAESGRSGWLGLLALSAGLGLANHVSSAMYLPAYAVIGWNQLRHVWRRPGALTPVLLGLIGPALYLYLPWRDAAGASLNYVDAYYDVDLQSFSGVWWMASGQAYRFFAFAYGLEQYLEELRRVGFAMWQNVTGLGLLLAALGWARLMQSRRRLGLATGWVVWTTVLFFAGYAVADKLTMLLPAYLVLALWIVLGAEAGLAWLASRIEAPAWPALSRAAVAVGLVGWIGLMGVFNWDRVDQRHARGAEVFARQAFGSVQPGALLVSEWSPAVTLEYFQQVEGLRPDVEIFNRSRFEVAAYYNLWRRGASHQAALQAIGDYERQAIASSGQGRAVYGTEYDPLLASEYEYLPSGSVYEMVPRRHDS